MADPRSRQRAPQGLRNHARFVPGYHYGLAALLALGLVGSLVSLFRQVVIHERGRLEASLVVLLTVVAIGLFWYCRVFALKAQDRAIRAEENLRHFALTGSLLDPRLTVYQIVALRFAADAELAELARRAAEEGLRPREIKAAIKTWRPDHHRV